MIAKLVVWGATRTEAISRAKRALREYRIRGIQTSIGFFRGLLNDPDFVSGVYDTGLLDRKSLTKLTAAVTNPSAAIIAAAVAAFDGDSKNERCAAKGQDRNRWTCQQ